MDAIPIFSQSKSLIQAICGQREQAKQTQKNFSRQCPIISQGRSFIEWSIYKDSTAAAETQRECGRFFLNIFSGLPIIGHVKGTVHYIVGDKAGGEIAMKAATRTTSVIAGGIGGFFVAGPVGATAASVAAGAAFDSTVTAVDSIRYDKFEPYGILEPFADPTNAGKWCDAIGGVALDGVTGYTTAKIIQKIQIKQAKGAGGKQSVTEVIAPEEAVRYKPSKLISTTKTIIIKAHQGYLYILKDGNLTKIKDEILRIIKRHQKIIPNDGCVPPEVQSNNTSEQNISFQPEATNEKNYSAVLPSTELGELSLKYDNGCVAVYAGDRMIMKLMDEKIYIIRRDGSSYELMDDTTYGLDDETNDIQEVNDPCETVYIDSIISKQDDAYNGRRTRHSTVSTEGEEIYEDAMDELFVQEFTINMESDMDDDAEEESSLQDPCRLMHKTTK